MRGNENSSSSTVFFRGISIRSLGRNFVSSMDGNQEQENEMISIFHRHVADQFIELLIETEADSEQILSIFWIRKLVDAFLCCMEAFKATIIMERSSNKIFKPPHDRLLYDWIDKAVKMLDICNAVNNGIETVRYWQKQAEIALKALSQNHIGEGQIRRAQKALSMPRMNETMEELQSDEKSAGRNRSFLQRKNSGMNVNHESNRGYIRYSLHIRQLSSNGSMPRGNEVNSFDLAIHTMSHVLVFVMWVLTTAMIPSPTVAQIGLPPRSMPWSGALCDLHDQIIEDIKRRKDTMAIGSVREVQRLQNFGKDLMGLTDTCSPELVAELTDICEKMENSLIPLQKQIREVFHRIIRNRSEILGFMSESNGFASQMS